LNGVGGRTIEEAKERLSYDEAIAWMEYVGLRGTLNIGMRVEVMIAQLLVMIAKANRIKKTTGAEFTLTDFAIHLDKPELSLESAAKALGVKKHG
jgi:hypothetical protein